MIELSPEIIAVLMFGGIIVGIAAGYPLAFIIFVTAVAVGYIVVGGPVFPLMYSQMFSLLRNYILLALPLFIYLGSMLGQSGLADRVYSSMYLWLSGFRGGLALLTILVGTVLAACVGVMGASVAMLTIVALPAMLKRGYNKPLACGSVAAGGTLGILIPPSIMMVVYGPMAGISVGKLFMAAFMPGFLLSFLYCIYIALRCFFKEELAPPIPLEERAGVPFLKKTFLLAISLVPPMIIVLAVLGTIFLGIAPPTEAAAVGSLAVTILAAAYRKLTWQVIKTVLTETMTYTARGMAIGGASIGFTAVFLSLGCGKVVQNLLLATPGGRWGVFAMVMFIYFILGFFIEWLGIFFIMVPLLAPLAPILGFDPLWFGMMICINLQTSFMTPPFAPAVYYVRGTSLPEWGVETIDIIRGVTPFVFLIIIALVLCTVFPEIILWLPSKMIK